MKQQMVTRSTELIVSFSRHLIHSGFELPLNISKVIRFVSTGASHNSRIYSGESAMTGDGTNKEALVNQAKKLAACQAVDDHIQDGQIIGIGSGSTVIHAVKRIAERVREEKLDLICIPTSFQAKDLIVSNKLRLSDLDVHFPIDVTIDGCDDCDSNLNVIKGGGGCLLQEKIVAGASKKLIIVADYTKDSTYLGEKWKKGIPLEVSQIGWKVVLEKLNRFPGGLASLRPALKKMGPVVTDNNNFVVDFTIGEALKTSSGGKHTPQTIENWLKTIPGILETGIFVGMASQAYFGMEDGTLKKTKEIIRKLY